MLRWDEFEAASLTYLESSLQDDFMQKLDELRKNRVNIADMRIKASNCINGVDNADAIVEFDYFALSDNRMKTVIDKQKWKLLRGDQLAAGQKAGWKLITPLPFFK